MSDNNNNTIGRQIAGMLLDAEAVKINIEKPFVWSSGWNSPIYCDNRLTLSYPAIRTFIKEKLKEAVLTNFPDAEAIAGVATAGIPQGALLAEALSLPFVYVRSKPKGHGMENLIEGKVSKSQKVVVVEDLVSTGGSSLKAAEALKSAGFDVLGMAAIFTYGFPISEENFKKAKLPLICLSNYTYIIEEAMDRGYINTEQAEKLKPWRLNPETWKPA